MHTAELRLMTEVEDDEVVISGVRATYKPATENHMH
jgi:hypothetical protein